MTFNLFHSPNFAANQQVSNMEIITFESNAYKELDKKITAIANYVFNHAVSPIPTSGDVTSTK